MASNVALPDLFFYHRLPDDGVMLLLLLYMPFGVLLLALRFFFVLQLLLMLTIIPKNSLIRRALLKVSCTILGIVVTQEGDECYSKSQTKVIVSNHVTSLDNIAIDMVIPAVMPFSKCKCPWFIKWLLGYKEFDTNTDGKSADDRVKEYLNADGNVPLLVFPEEIITNGKRGLLKFNPWGFQFSSSILPVLISVRRPPLVPLPPSVLTSGWWQDAFWTLFVPYTHYRIRFLPPIQAKSDDFGDDVQKYMASALGVTPTNYAAEDVNELIKSLQARAAQSTVISSEEAHNGGPPGTPRGRSPPQGEPQNASPTTRLTRMVLQVKEVLPQVPSDVIARDLSRTHCVDGTITNILEGRVRYVPEKESLRTPSKSNSTSTPTIETSNLTNQVEVKFSRLPEERQALLNKRKAMMLENARRRFATKQS